MQTVNKVWLVWYIGSLPIIVACKNSYVVLHEVGQSLRQYFEHGKWRVRILVTAHVREGPGDGPREGHLEQVQTLDNVHQRLDTAVLCKENRVLSQFFA